MLDPADRYAQQFQESQDQYKTMLEPMQQELQTRQAYEGSPAYQGWANRLGRAVGLGGRSANELQQQMVSGQFGGGGGPSLGGFNPFHTPDAAGQLGQASQAMQGMQGQYDQATQSQVDSEGIQSQLDQLGSRLQDAVLPEQRTMIQSQMQRLQQQLDAPQGSQSPYARQLRHRMQSLRMNDPLSGAPSDWVMGQGGSPGRAPAASMPYASLANNPWGIDDRIRRYALDPEDRGERNPVRVRPMP